jgi:hypothetical protein
MGFILFIQIKLMENTHRNTFPTTMFEQEHPSKMVFFGNF